MPRRILAIATVALAGTALAQGVAPSAGHNPFYFPQASLIEREIPYTGAAAEDGGGSGSGDSQQHRTLTLNFSPQLSAGASYNMFAYQTISGFVGCAPTPSGISHGLPAGPSMLDKPGMVRVAALASNSR